MTERQPASEDWRATWLDEPGLRPVVLEQRFPHVLQRIAALWDNPQLEGFLHGLLGPLRPGTAGFPREALAEIAKLGKFRRTQGLATGSEASSRETLLTWLNYDQHIYPYALEAGFPELLAGMLPLLDSRALGDYIDALLTPAKQLHHRFPEAVLVELMTLKAIQRAKLAGAATNGNGRDDDHHAAQVLERHTRR